MLDINFIRENPGLIREAAQKKHIAVDVERILELDEKRRSLIKEGDDFRAEQNAASEKITSMTGEEREQAISAMRSLKEKINQKEEELKNIEDEYMRLMLLVPNIPDLSVPEGESDADNKEIRTGGKIPTLGFEV